MIKSSGLKAITATIKTGPCRLMGVSLTADEDKTLTIIVYPDTSATGTEVAFGRASGGNVATDVEGGACNFNKKWTRDDNFICDNGLHAVLSATDSGDYIVYYEDL